MDYKAFVASTFKGLMEHRLHVIGELRRRASTAIPRISKPLGKSAGSSKMKVAKMTSSGS